MRRSALVELVKAVEDAAHAGTAKNIYEAYGTSKRQLKHKEKKAEDLLVSLCTKLAFSVPKIPAPRMPFGASRAVGKVGPSGMIGGAPKPPGAQALSGTAAGGVVNPRRSIGQAISANTLRASP